MIKFGKMSLKNKLLGLIMLCTELSLAAFFLLGIAHYYATNRSNQVDAVRTETLILSDVIAAALVFNDKAAATNILEKYSRKEDVIAIDVYGKDALLFSSHSRTDANRRYLSPQAFDILESGKINEGDKENYVYRISNSLLTATFVAPVMLDSEPIGVIQYYISTRSIFKALFNYILLAFAVVLVISLAAYLVSNVMQRLISLPIERLVTAIQGITRDGNYASRVEKTSSDELGILIDHFNRMLEEIERRDGQLARHRNELERTVDQRTQALTVSNAKLGVALEEAEQARETAERASRAKSQFLANMSHEIRTPMHGVLGNVDLLLKTALTDRQRRLAQTINSSGKSLLSIISDILDFSKIESAKLSLERSDFDLWRAVEDVCELFDRTATEKGLRLTLTLPPDLPRYLCGDVTRLRQVLTNLLSNAVKFTESGEIVVGVVALPSVDRGIHLRFSVRDNGIGISPEARARIFEAFSQADDSTTRRFGGTGLGLAICRELVRLMGGEIDVDSVPNEGSTFSFTAVFEKARTAAAPWLSAADGRGRRVLVISADAGERQRLAACLSHWGLDPEAVAALSLAEGEWRGADPGYALVVVDAAGLAADETNVLGDMLAAGPPLPLLIVEDAEPTLPRRSGCATVAYLQKPVRRSHLYDAVLSLFKSAESGAKREPGPVAPRQPVVSRAARVLVAEDNLVNQELARDCLELLGCSVEIVGNGGAAIEAVRQGQWDMVMMDCHMPEVDGFEATRRIREEEGQRGGGQRQTIVALTASATREDRDRCLAVGMDDYLSKPFTPDQLAAVLNRWLGDPGHRRPAVLPDGGASGAAIPGAPPSEIQEPAAAATDSVLDPQALANVRALQRPGRPNILHKAISLFLEQAPQQLAAILDAIRHGDAGNLRMAAHTLKSSSAYLGATALSELCKQFEIFGRVDCLESAAGLVPQAVATFEQARDALAAERGRTTP